MKVALDVSAAGQQVGIGVYALELARSLAVTAFPPLRLRGVGTRFPRPFGTAR